MNNALKAMASGLAGAVVLTVVHETLRRFVPNAPRMDVLGMRSIEKLMTKADQEPPHDKEELHNWALAGDVVSNSLYYSLAGTGKNAWWRGVALGAAAGAGAVLLPGPLGLGEEPSNKTTKTQVMTVSYYLLGGLVAAALGYALGSDDSDD
ncbi:hypothetical protein ABID22_003517 [Pontibacter aydingkolensis]|uniref:Uncharacterized protein n=1 Tax=Pontibacter aydingkolensis TaxID=1911536 RepID=A0ABS7CY89_9BACT|nr:hypothetical protein [Pontibacter aydingkolensis]MBW7468828.1 hypothetical protein [Pontibacter aydingkolensis]